MPDENYSVSEVVHDGASQIFKQNPVIRMQSKSQVPSSYCYLQSPARHALLKVHVQKEEGQGIYSGKCLVGHNRCKCLRIRTRESNQIFV